MKRLLIIFLFTFIYAGQAKPPYETTWMELEITGNGYIVKNYPNLDEEIKLKSPIKTIIKQDTIVRINFSDGLWAEKIDSIKNLGNEKYIFVVHKHDVYKFEWFDKKKHIARWIKFYYDGRVMLNNLYIDSLYNTYPIVDHVWDIHAVEGED